jgi:hypothetical protein
VAQSCLKAARVLHAQDIVHTDFRLLNIVWLSEVHCMVIDLEDCKDAVAPLPANCEPLRAWDEHTLEQRDGQLYFTPASDLYQIGLMLREVLKPDWSPEAHAFVGVLLNQRQHQGQGGQGAQALTAHAALQHGWLQQA